MLQLDNPRLKCAVVGLLILYGLLVCIAPVLMIVLKMTGVTPDLSWWWITCPLWGGAIAYYALPFVCFAVEAAVGSLLRLVGQKKD